MMHEIPEENKRNFFKVLLVLVIILSAYFAMKFLAEVKAYGMMGSTEPSIVTLTGHGEVTAVPDIASVYFTIRKEGKTVKEAQDSVAQIEKQALDFLKTTNILDKDIQVANASFNPQYQYQYDTKTTTPCNQYGCPPRPGKNVISGYEASEGITVKIRNTDDVGKVMQGLGTVGVEDLNGPNFTIDNEDGLKAQARKAAIDDAQAKAKVLAGDLKVRLGHITSFNESGNYPMPILYGKTMSLDSVAPQVAPAEIPKGENTISSDVTITYEIR